MTQSGRRRDAGQTQCRRKADAERRRTDASQKRPEAWTQEGRRRKHQLLSSTHNIYCIWLFRSIKEIHISFLVTLLYFSRNNTLHKMEKSNKDSQIFSFRALNASAAASALRGIILAQWATLCRGNDVWTLFFFGRACVLTPSHQNLVKVQGSGWGSAFALPHLRTPALRAGSVGLWLPRDRLGHFSGSHLPIKTSPFQIQSFGRSFSFCNVPVHV